MSRNDELLIESRSSVAINRNAKGEAQVSVKLYDGDTSDERLSELVISAVAGFLATEALLRSAEATLAEAA